MHHSRLAWPAALGAVMALVVPSVAAANEVTKWNEIAVSTVNAQSSPLVSAAHAGPVFVAMASGAVYGAVNATDRHGRPYLVNRSFPKADGNAAAATAAFAVLDALFPDQHAALRVAYDASLAAIPDGAPKSQGVAVGTTAAEAMLAQGHDGRTVIGCAFGSGLPGVWLPLPGPAGPLCDPAAWIRDAVPFLIESPSQFRTAGPYPLGSAAYAADVNEVKSIGSINSAVRTATQTHAAAFWQTNPSANYNAIGRRFVDQFSLGLSESARLFALLDLSSADALISAWNDKYHWNFWRPITAIRHADTDGNPATTAEPAWTPLFDPSCGTAICGAGPALLTPPYPDHPSGATSVASAAMHAFASFFGTDEMTFYATSSRFPGEQRVFTHFSDLTNEVLEARIWAGIHFRNTDVQAAALGRDVERYIHTHYFAAAP